jgi:hypothetical protein
MFVIKGMRPLKRVSDFSGIQKEKLEKMGSFSTVSYLSVDFDYVCGLELIFPLWLFT